MSKNIKQQLVEVSKLMYDKGMVNAQEGNLSVIDNNRIYMTPSSVCKGFLTEEMIVVTDTLGNVLEGTYRPSSEMKMHLAAYRCRPEIKSVIHAHSPYATAFAVANKSIETKGYAEMIMFFDKIPLAAYGTPSTPEIYKEMELLMGVKEYDIVLLANHGIVSIGSDVYDAFFKLESAESIAKTLIYARLLGGEKDLPEEKLMELNDLRKKIKKK